MSDDESHIEIDISDMKIFKKCLSLNNFRILFSFIKDALEGLKWFSWPH